MFARATLLTVALCLSGIPAMAEGDRLLTALDTDGDGALSRAEFMVLREEMFARIDSDGSGALTEAEVTAAQEAAAERMRQKRDLWSQDADGDGQLTLAEFTSKTPGFDRADRDGDGVLSQAELDRVAALLGQFAGRE